MNIPTDEQIKEFWEYFGWHLGGIPDFIGDNKPCTVYWVSPDNIAMDLPPIDLNNLFKYAVPKLQEMGYQIDIVCFEHKGYDVCVFSTIKDIKEHESYRGDILEYELFRAIWEVIHALDKGEEKQG